MNKILIIEDDKDIHEMLKTLLIQNRYSVLSAYSGTEGILVYDVSIDLVLLDLMLPGKSGKEIITELKSKKNVPVLVMSAIHELDTKLDLFELGAEDYITKPFSNEELLARIKVHLRNKKQISTSILRFKDLMLDKENYQVFCNQQEVVLTRNEFELLKVLMDSPNQVLTKSTLFDLVWGDEDSADDNTLNVHISKIRNKLKDKNPNMEYIETIWSVGYRMKK